MIMTDNQTDQNTDQKKWDKLNVIPGTTKKVKRIAGVEGKYVYQVVEEALKEKYPEYFQEEMTTV